MSDYVDPKYSPRQLNLQIVNCYVGIHDTHCHCKEPLKHIIKQIEQQEPSIKQWRDTSTAATGNQDGEDALDAFGPGELEKLFAQDDEENAG